MALAEELGMRPLTARCYLALGQLYGRRGRLDEARAHLATAIEGFRSMDMTSWLARAEAARAGLACGSPG